MRLVILGIGILFLVFGILGLGRSFVSTNLPERRAQWWRSFLALVAPKQTASPSSFDKRSCSEHPKQQLQVSCRGVAGLHRYNGVNSHRFAAAIPMQFLVYAIITSSLCFEYLGAEGYALSSIAFAQELLAVVAVLVVVAGASAALRQRGRRLLARFRRACGARPVRVADEWS